MAVSCVVTLFPSGGMFLIFLKAQVRKYLCLSPAPSNSAGMFVISCCRDWGLYWKEHWLCPFTAFVALISKWHSVVLGIILRGGKPVFPPSPGADTETLGETVKAFSRPARALAFRGRAGAVQAWACPEAALGFVSLIFSLWCGSMCRVLCQPTCYNYRSINLFLCIWAKALILLKGWRWVKLWDTGGGCLVTSFRFSSAALRFYLVEFCKFQECVCLPEGR